MDKITYLDLELMRSVDIQSIDPDILVDIRDIKVDNNKPISERAYDYISQVKKPYCFRCGKILIKIEHSETDKTIEDCMEGYFRSLCSGL